MIWAISDDSYVVNPNPEHHYLSTHQENSNHHDLIASKHKPYDDSLKLIDRCKEQPKDLYNLTVRTIYVRRAVDNLVKSTYLVAIKYPFVLPGWS